MARSDEPTRTIEVVLDGPLAATAVPELCRKVRLLLEASGAELVICDVAGLVGTGPVVLDALARLQLTAKRLGSSMRLRNPPSQLRDLLALTGFAEILTSSAPGESSSVPGWDDQAS